MALAHSTRGANFVVAITRCSKGTILERPSNSDEYMLVLPENVGAHLVAGLQDINVAGDTLCIMPPGASTITLDNEGDILRIFSSRASDLAEMAINSAAYTVPSDGIAPLSDWPEPNGGFKIRHYDLGSYVRKDGPLIQPRIFRSANLMVNIFAPWHALRETSKLGPHYHDDFEQDSICMKGRFVHHIRYPWNSDLDDWHGDEHTEIASPSVTVIPPPLIHTTRNATTDGAILIDVFASPRADFSLKPGFVLNADDYPLPEYLAKESTKALASNVASWSY